MACAEEKLAELADRIMSTVMSGQESNISRMDLVRATTFYENIGDELMKKCIPWALNAFQQAVIMCTANHRQQSSRNLQEQMSKLTVKIGHCYGQMGILGESIDHYDLAQHVDPNNLDAKYNLATALFMVGDVEMSANIVQNVLSQPPTSITESTQQKFKKLNYDLLMVFMQENMPSPANLLNCEEEDNVLSSHISTMEVPSLVDTLSTEPEKAEGACADIATLTESSVTSRRSKKSRSRSRSRSSRSRSNSQHMPMPKPLPALTTNEQRRLDKLRLRDISRIGDELKERKAKDLKHEEEKRKRTESEEEKNTTRNYPTDFNFRHLVPGFSGSDGHKKKVIEKPKKNVAKGTEEKTQSTTQEPISSGGTNQAKNQPVVPPSFDTKFVLCFACSDCYIVNGYGQYGFNFLSGFKHHCARTILMVKSKSKHARQWVKVRPRPPMIEMKSRQFRLCEQYRLGHPCNFGEVRCTFTHNEVEREIWGMDANSPSFTLATLIAEQQKWIREKDKVNTLDRDETTSEAQMSDSRCALQEAPLPDISCPFLLKVVCGTCWSMFGTIATKKGNTCSTLGFKHMWESHRAFLLKPENTLIRKLVLRQPQTCTAYVLHARCSAGKSCRFFHDAAELKVYHWMHENKITKLDDVVLLAAATEKTKRKRAMVILKGQALPIQPLLGDQASSGDRVLRHVSQRKCKVCNECFSDQLTYDQHCTSRTHETNLLTDKGRPWRYRPPPWGVVTPRLCEGVNNGSCPYAEKPDMYNKCSFAHSTMELDEWKERIQYFIFKKAIMKEPGIFSYVHKLQQEFAKVKLESDMMMAEVDGVKIDVSPNPVLFSNKKDAAHTWTITISSQIELQKVSLLLEESRFHFNLTHGSASQNSLQVEGGERFLTSTATNTDKHYTVRVRFNAGLFGSFEQKVIFDFGTRPLLAVTLDVEVGTDFVRDQIITLRKELPVDRWTSKTHTIVSYSATAARNLANEEVLCSYKPPDVTVFSQDSLDGDLNHNNYVHRMHRMIDMEEFERTHIASKFNVEAEVELSKMLPGKEDIQAPMKQLFGRVALTNCLLSEDSDEGYLMLHGAVTAWVAPPAGYTSEGRPTVFEAHVVCETNFGFDGRGMDHFYVCLSKRCCNELRLQDGQIASLSVQLQIDRLPLARMHYGLDQLPDTSVVFPNLAKYVHEPSNSTEHKLPFLNKTQQDVVDHMAVSRTKYTVPIIMYGPFGSGKTETLARAIEEIVSTKPKARILICTLSDSAADLYITQYLGHSKCIEQNQILRVYSPNRWTNTVSMELQPFCQKAKLRLKLPDLEAVEEHKIIITTLATSLMLTDSNMRGCFSHIIIDEAAQCLECEAIMPLTMATNTTCVVLAGDHLQLGPKSFITRETPKRLKLGISILERLVRYYFNYDLSNQKRLVKLLKVSYRSHPRITAFISEHFYDNAIECESKWEYDKPLTFYATHGKESTDADSTSYYNTSEVDELVKRITHLYNNWPQSWGERPLQKIAVLTPYSQQVKKIKTALAQTNECFKNIKVSTVPDIQGDEFHAVFLSTVRTHHGAALGCDDDTYGFFSDTRVVNTAITRAKYHVAVVGHPASLTSFGYCKNIWRSYLDWCSQDGCLYPKSLTLGEVRLQVEALKDKLESQSPHNLQRSQRIFDIAEIQSDEIIQNLRGMTETTDSNTQLEIIERDHRTIYRFSARQSKCEDPVVYIRKKRKWKPMPVVCTVRHSMNDSDYEELYSDEDMDEDEDSSNGDSNVSQDCDRDQILSLLKKDTEKYKRCTMTIKGSEEIFAHNMNRKDKMHVIAISRQHYNRSFDGDEVVIEIISTNDIPHGKVIGILKRVIECKKFVCRVDPYNHSIVMPLNRGVPRIRNLTPESRKAKGVAVYSFPQNRHPKLQTYHRVDLTKPSAHLFIVQYLKWERNFTFPLGIVIGTLPTCISIEDNERLLRLEYNLHPRNQKNTKEHTAELCSEGISVSKAGISGREDFRNLTTFTIDSKGSKDLDDALSVEKLSVGLRISIHIADVSHFVDPNTEIDIEAKKQCVTFYSIHQDPITMLPPELTEELLSLQPETDRFTISVIFEVDEKEYKQMKTPEVKRGIICSNAKLTYEETQQIFDGEFNQPGLQDVAKAVCLLRKVAKAWSYTRLGHRSHVFHQKGSSICTEAHQLVEEMMIQANHEVSKILINSVFNEIVPLRVQESPNKESLNDWNIEYHEAAKLSLSLQMYNTASMKEDNSTLQDSKVIIRHQVVSKIKDALKDHNDSALKQLIGTSMGCPESTVAEVAYNKIQESAKYTCSGDLDESSYVHANLKIKPYCHFTSPIRRYIDIVAHRLVTAHINHTSTIYTVDEVRSICKTCNKMTEKNQQYDKDVESVKLRDVIKKYPLVVYPVVDCVSEVSFHVCFPTLTQLPYSLGTIMLSDLSLNKLPVYDAEHGTLDIDWDIQIYNYTNYKVEGDPIDPTASNLTCLDKNRFVEQIPRTLWYQLLECIEKDDTVMLRQKSEELLTTAENNKRQDVESKEMCNESMKFQLQVFKNQVHRIQLSTNLLEGYLQANIQLVTLTDSLELCVEHQRHPITCYTNGACLKVTRDFGSTKEYIKTWNPVLKVEAAYDAISTCESYILKNVPITWTRKENQIWGEINLSTQFCEDNDVFTQGGGQAKYLCVRVDGITIPDEVLNEETIQTALVKKETCFVGHCLVTKLLPLEEGGVTSLQFILHQSSMSFPDQLLQTKCIATIQAIAMSIPMQRMLRAIGRIEDDSMAKFLALGRRPPPLDKQTKQLAKNQIREWESDTDDPKLNEAQKVAIDEALTRTFMVIQGPPGTGKTVTGAKIAYMFAQINKKDKSKVLYCGPSNKSIEVVVDKLKKWSEKLMLVRVYSNDVVELRYPNPTRLKIPRRLQSKDAKKVILNDCKHEDIALHALIRDPKMCDHAEEIKAYDKMFSQQSKNRKRKEMEKHWKRYLKIIKLASEIVLCKADVVCTTCIGSASAIIVHGLRNHIKQVIIDEAAMTLEPECLVPLTSYAPEQLVLIGDHMQLQPVVCSMLARKLGMTRSLFARYIKEKVMLTTQYRMHEAIAKLPSQLFYNNELQCGTPEQCWPSELKGLWAGGQWQPITFVDVRGEEFSQVIATADGSTKSKYNPKEAAYTAEVVKKLIEVRKICDGDIQVLSQYRAHCGQLRQELKSYPRISVDVTTVTKSQGSEYDYVVLSTVRSLPDVLIEKTPPIGWIFSNLGIVASANQMNVAITRARKGLIIIGNYKLLSTCSLWEKLFDHYKMHGAIVSQDEFLQRITST